MSEWRDVPVRELCTAIIDCVNKTAPTVQSQTPYRMIRTTNVRHGRVDLANVRYVERSVYERWVRRGRPEPGDVVLTREAPLGEVGMLRDAAGIFLGQRLVMYRADSHRADRNFLLYAMRSPEVQAQIKAFGSGATVEHMRVPDCGELLISCPDLGTQQRIGAVLAAFDELIEINERRIELLEDIGRSLYREWFVRFRFPGSEDAQFVDTGIGLVPAGWRVDHLRKFVTTQYGYTASASAEAVGPRFLRGMDINKRSYIDWSDVPYCSISSEQVDKFRLEVGDVCVIRMADPGKVGVVERPVNAVFASYLVRLRSTNPRLSFQHLGHYLRDDPYQAWVTGSSTGTTRKSASAQVLTDPPIAVPPINIAKRFAREVGVLRSELNVLVEQNAALSSTRDLLLPRLVTGRLDISDFDLRHRLPDEDLS